MNERRPNDFDADIAVVGGGPAGLNAALVLGRARRRVIVIDEGKPRNAGVPHAYGFLGHDGINPAALLELGRAEIAKYGVQLLAGRVDAIVPEDAFRFRVRSEARELRVRAIVLAMGLRDVLPEIEGLREIWGVDANECPYCHGWEARDSRIAVVGSTVKLPNMSALLTCWSRDVIIISSEAANFDDEDNARLRALGVRVIAEDVARFETEAGRLARAVTAGGQTIPRDQVFVAMPATAPSDLAATICEVDDRGFPIIDADWATSRPGVWAVGNATDEFAKLVHCAAAGGRAAFKVHNTLFEADLAALLTQV